MWPRGVLSTSKRLELVISPQFCITNRGSQRIGRIFGHSAIKSRSLPLMGYCGVEGKDLFLSIVIDLTSMMNNKNEESSMRRFNASNNW